MNELKPGRLQLRRHCPGRVDSASPRATLNRARRRVPPKRALRISLFLLGIMTLTSLFVVHCDAYTCTTESCGDSSSWERCIACSGDSCTYEARDSNGDTHATCDYDTSNKSARDACFNQTNSAGDGICSGNTPAKPNDPTSGCAQYASCEGCTNAGCAFCAPSGQCQATSAPRHAPSPRSICRATAAAECLSA